VGEPILRVTVVLINGDEIVEEIDEADMAQLLDRKRHRYVIDESWSEREVLKRIVVTEMSYRLTKGTGQLSLFDLDRTHWLIPPSMIVAIKLEDLDEQLVGAVEDFYVKRIDEGGD
jgi:hypothetical protein